MRQNIKEKAIVKILKKNSRATLTDISKLTGIPISTVFDILARDIVPKYEFTIIDKNLINAEDKMNKDTLYFIEEYFESNPSMTKSYFEMIKNLIIGKNELS